MRVSVDVAVAKPGPVPPGTITLAGQVRAELDKVDQLLEGLLVLARAEHGALPGRARAPAGLRRVGGPGRARRTRSPPGT